MNYTNDFFNSCFEIIYSGVRESKSSAFRLGRGRKPVSEVVILYLSTAIVHVLQKTIACNKAAPEM